MAAVSSVAAVASSAAPPAAAPPNAAEPPVDNSTPIRQVLVIIEHKIRNLEKRKVSMHTHTHSYRHCARSTSTSDFLVQMGNPSLFDSMGCLQRYHTFLNIFTSTMIHPPRSNSNRSRFPHHIIQCLTKRQGEGRHVFITERCFLLLLALLICDSTNTLYTCALLHITDSVCGRRSPPPTV